MYPDLLGQIDRSNRDWLTAWGCVVEQTAQAAVCVNPDYDHYNGIFAIQCLGREVAALIQNLAQRIEEESDHKAAVWLDEYCNPRNLPEILPGLGFEITSTSYIMHARPEEVKANPNPGLDTVRVENGNGLTTWAKIYCQAFDRMDRLDHEMRRWSQAFSKQLMESGEIQFFLGSNGVDAVATGQLITTEGVGGIYSIGTLPDFRQRGLGSAMTAELAKAAEALGLPHLYLIAQNGVTRKFYEGLGFKEVLQTQIWEQT